MYKWRRTTLAGQFGVTVSSVFLPSGTDAVLRKNEQDFLYVRTIDGAVRVRGRDAAQNATALQEAGVRVYRSHVV
jgi:hypothetical protein